MKHFQITLISICIICTACSKTGKKNNLLVSSLESLNYYTINEIDEKLRIIQNNIEKQPKYHEVLLDSKKLDSLRKNSILKLKTLNVKSTTAKIDTVIKIANRFSDLYNRDHIPLLKRELLAEYDAEGALIEFASNWILNLELNEQSEVSRKTAPFCQPPDLLPFYVTIDLRKNQNTHELTFEIPQRMSEYSIDEIMFGENKIEGNPRLINRPASVTLKFKQPLKAGKYDVSGNQIIRHMCF